ncbi:hypothetical protein XBFM1_1740014 [Xenorhabdus bovienii str. feltiae Moldova]|uniref:Uncharacterized protein n=1 Tax=Xenorhabdus bovienii str. feltiae Moldova TaxID=1398200 RepID=A0A077NSS5_XENBV|nr:hypothetical protein XBFM1_1740014 [Xenorhabdus bovienii str. feltiae Moldova]
MQLFSGEGKKTTLYSQGGMFGRYLVFFTHNFFTHKK